MGWRPLPPTPQENHSPSAHGRARQDARASSDLGLFGATTLADSVGADAHVCGRRSSSLGSHAEVAQRAACAERSVVRATWPDGSVGTKLFRRRCSAAVRKRQGRDTAPEDCWRRPRDRAFGDGRRGRGFCNQGWPRGAEQAAQMAKTWRRPSVMASARRRLALTHGNFAERGLETPWLCQAFGRGIRRLRVTVSGPGIGGRLDCWPTACKWTRSRRPAAVHRAITAMCRRRSAIRRGRALVTDGGKFHDRDGQRRTTLMGERHRPYHTHHPWPKCPQQERNGCSTFSQHPIHRKLSISEIRRARQCA